MLVSKNIPFTNCVEVPATTFNPYEYLLLYWCNNISFLFHSPTLTLKKEKTAWNASIILREKLRHMQSMWYCCQDWVWTWVWKRFCLPTKLRQNPFWKKDLLAKIAAHLNTIKRINFLGALFSISMGILFIYFSFLGFGLVYNFVFRLGISFAVYGIITQLINVIIFLNQKTTSSIRV